LNEETIDPNTFAHYVDLFGLEQDNQLMLWSYHQATSSDDQSKNQSMPVRRRRNVSPVM